MEEKNYKKSLFEISRENYYFELIINGRYIMEEKNYKKSLFEISRENYYFELDRKESITENVKYNISLFIIELSAMYYVSTKIDLINKTKELIDINALNLSNIIFIIMGLLLSISSVLLIVAFFKIHKILFKDYYKLLPTTEDIDKYITQYQGDKEKEYNDLLFEGIINATSKNAKINDKRSELLNDSLKYIIYGFVLFLFTFILHGLIYFLNNN